MSEANSISDGIADSIAKVCARAVKAERSMFGESRSTLQAACDRVVADGASNIEAYAQRVAWEKAEPLRSTIDQLRAENDRLRARIATRDSGVQP